MPVIILVGISTGTLYMVGIAADNGELEAHDVATDSTEFAQPARRSASTSATSS